MTGKSTKGSASDQRTQPERHLSSVKALRLPLLAIFVCCASAWLVFLAPTDVTRYQCYALTFWFGSHATTWLPTAQCAFLNIASPQPAFHLLPLEYPPLALLVFSFPLLLPLPYYALAFALLMLFIVGSIYWLLVQFHSQRAASRFLLLLALGASVLVQVRFDLLPAVCMLICLLAAERKRWRVAYSALAIGVLLKLYPLIALPALFLAEQDAGGRLRASFGVAAAEGGSRWRQMLWQMGGWQWKHLSLFSGILAGVTGCFALLNPQAAVVGPVNYFIQRPTQIESLQGSLLWLAHYAGVPFQMVFSYGSLNALSPLASPASWASMGLCILGCLFIFRLQWRHTLPLGQAMIALLCLLIITGKVFSPQYLIWLIPLLAYVGAGRIWLCGWCAVSLCTTIIYIAYYSHLSDPATAAQTIQTLPGFFEAVSVRNGAFLSLTLAYLFNWFRARQGSLRQLVPAVRACSDVVSKSRTQSTRAEKRR
jgi:hypothetical protein